MLFLFDTTCLDHALMASALIIPGQEPVEPSQAPQRIHQESTGLQWRSKHPLTITEKPAIKRCLKTLHHNISVYEDVARCLQEQECVKTKFKAHEVAYKNAHVAIPPSERALQGCPFYKAVHGQQQPRPPTSRSRPSLGISTTTTG